MILRYTRTLQKVEYVSNIIDIGTHRAHVLGKEAVLAIKNDYYIS